MDQNKKGPDGTKNESKPGGPEQVEKGGGLADDLDAVLQKQLNDKLKAGTANGKTSHDAAMDKKADDKKANDKKAEEKKADDKKEAMPAPLVPPKADEKKAEAPAPLVPPKADEKKAEAPAPLVPPKADEKKGVPPVSALPAFTMPPKPEEKKAEAPVMPAFSMPPPKPEEKKTGAPAMPAFSMPPPKLDDKKAEAPAMPAFSMPPPKLEDKKAEAPAIPAFTMSPKIEEIPAPVLVATSPLPLEAPEQPLPPLSLAAEPATPKKDEPPASQPASSTEDDAEPLPTPGKDAFVAAAEKERVLKLIRDAATKRMEETPDPRAMKVDAAEKTESAPAPVEEQGAESASGSTFAVTEDVVVTTPVTQEANESAPSPEDDLKPFGHLIPPAPRIPISSMHHKAEMPSPSQTRLNEAFVRQLKGAPPVSAPAPKAAAAVEAEAAQSAKPNAVKRVASRRRVAEDGSIEIPVESLGAGLYNALGDMVGGVVHASRKISDKVGGGSAQESPPAESGPSNTGTDRAAKKVAKGVHGVFGGASEIVKGGGNIVIGAVGIVTMPVFGAVGSVVRAFMPEKKNPAEKSQ